MLKPLIDPKCEALGLTVSEPIETDGLHWELSHLWLTENGNWDSVPDFARDFQTDHLGGDHHVYVLGYRLDMHRAEEERLFVLGWPDGHHIFSPKREHEWWGNAIINAGFNWQKTPGPYYAQMNAINTSVVYGIGLPYPPPPWKHMGARHHWDGETMTGDIPVIVSASGEDTGASVMGGLHTSFFLVFQEVEGYIPEPEPPIQEQFLRVLDKAEAAADQLVGQNEQAAAGKIYLGIAELLSWQ